VLIYLKGATFRNMKHLYIIFILTLLSCAGEDSSGGVYTEETVAETHFDWLLGNWKRVNDEGEKVTYETWWKSDTSSYHGFGYTLLKSDTVWQEKIYLVKTSEGWNFEVITEGEPAPTVFKLTDISGEAFTSQNPEHDFPTQIKYSKNGESLKAIISGEGMEIPFDFERIK